MSRFALLALALGGSLFAGVLPPYNVSNGSPSFVVDYNGFHPDASNVIPGLTAQVTYSNFVFTNVSGATQVQFDFSVHNNSTITSRVSGLGFNSNPNVNVSTSTVSGGPDFFNNVNSGNYPNAIGNVDFCFINGSGNSCAGGGGTGILDGQTEAGTAVLKFSSLFTTLTFDNFYVRYQSLNYCATPGCTNPVTSAAGTAVSTVPEPRLILFLSAGVIGVLATRFRRRTAA